MWKPAWWLGNSELTDEHLVRTDDGIVCARCVRRVNEKRWPEENLRRIAETPQKPMSTTLDTHPVPSPQALAWSSAPEGNVKEESATVPIEDEDQTR